MYCSLDVYNLLSTLLKKKVTVFLVVIQEDIVSEDMFKILN